MIYTRFGSPVTVVASETDDKSQMWVKVKYSDGETKVVPMYELKADDGLAEICKAVDSVKGISI